MTIHRISTMAAFPYFTQKTVQNDEDRALMRILWAIKDGDDLVIKGKPIAAGQWFADAFKPDSRDRPFLNKTRTLVPIPRSSVMQRPLARNQWAGFDIATRLAQRGYARDCRAIVRRARSVRSSKQARARGEDPPTVVEHFESMSVDRDLLKGVKEITLVDDVVSAGRNSMGAYLRLREEGFEGDVKLLAVSYTNYTPGVRDPFYGRIIWREGAKSFRRSLADDGDEYLLPPIGSWSADPPGNSW